MSQNFWQDKWLKDQYNRTEQKEREAELARRKKSEESAAQGTQRPDANQVAKRITDLATGNERSAPKEPTNPAQEKKKPSV